MPANVISFITNNYFFKRFPFTKQLTKFAIIGVSSFIIDLLIYYALTRNFDFFGHNYLLANVISFMVAVVWSFLWNKFWTFRVSSNANIMREYFKFLVTSAIGLGLNSGLLYLAVSHLHIFDIFAKFYVAIIVMIWNFSVNKFWTFKHHKVETHEVERNYPSL